MVYPSEPVDLDAVSRRLLDALRERGGSTLPRWVDGCVASTPDGESVEFEFRDVAGSSVRGDVRLRISGRAVTAEYRVAIANGLLSTLFSLAVVVVLVVVLGPSTIPWRPVLVGYVVLLGLSYAVMWSQWMFRMQSLLESCVEAAQTTAV